MTLARLIQMVAIVLATLALPEVPPCPTEDSYSCVWVAPDMGSGPEDVAHGRDPGQSFITGPERDPGPIVVYVPHWLARAIAEH